MNIELYINNKLCDMWEKDFPIRIRRQFFKPSELNTKDAQASYSIKIPTTTKNNEVFNFKNIEESQKKFSVYYDASVYCGGISIFEGKFMLSEITDDYYQGNLVIPKQQSIKDIFEDMKLGQINSWNIDFEGYDSITELNKKDNPPCFFPLVLYGLLGKKKSEGGTFSNKTVIDSSNIFTLQDFPPSINCLDTIKRIFEKKNFHITGTAFNNEHLKRLYMSYHNPNDYEMLFNYGKLAHVGIGGEWTNYDSSKNVVAGKDYDSGVDSYMNINAIDGVSYYAIDLLQGKNFKKRERSFINPGNIYRNNKIHIPRSGLYRITLHADLTLNNTLSNEYWRGENNVMVTTPRSGSTISDLLGHRFEIKLMRSVNGTAVDKNLIKWDNSFHRNNYNQIPGDNPQYPYGKNGSTERMYKGYYPEPGQTNFIDPEQNKHYLCGLAFGRTRRSGEDLNRDINPLDSINGYDKGTYAYPTAMRNGYSWNGDNNFQALAATYSESFTSFNTTVIAGKNRIALQNVHTSKTCAYRKDNFSGGGDVSMIVWLNAGEEISLYAVSDETDRNERIGWLWHTINFSLDLRMFDTNREWLSDKMNDDNSSKDIINWELRPNAPTDSIDLSKFLPQNVKIDSWLENFCKAFNLMLTQVGENNFELNMKQTIDLNTSYIIDLDTKTNIGLRLNQPLELPACYDVGFTINKDEEGFHKSNDDGGGEYQTNALNGDVVKQTSNFSYNWFKEITDQTKKKTYKFPVITNKEIWKDTTRDYLQMMGKQYYELPQRFWFKDNSTDMYTVNIDGQPNIGIALVSNKFTEGKELVLNYENQPNSILRNFFAIFVNNEMNYTIVECFLTPEEYMRVKKSLIKFNGDIYYCAEIDGYDPQMKNRCKMKLIKK